MEKKIQQYKVYCVRFNYSDELLVKSDCIEKPWLNIYISYENFDNRLLVGVEFKFLKLKW